MRGVGMLGSLDKLCLSAVASWRDSLDSFFRVKFSSMSVMGDMVYETAYNIWNTIIYEFLKFVNSWLDQVVTFGTGLYYLLGNMVWNFTAFSICFSSKEMLYYGLRFILDIIIALVLVLVKSLAVNCIFVNFHMPRFLVTCNQWSRNGHVLL